MAYASRTGTRRNLAALREAGWRLMVSATGVLRNEGFRYALDNGAWTAHQQQRSFDEALFARALGKMGAEADFVVVPDIVAGGLRSLEFSLAWLDRVLAVSRRVLLPVQDGMDPRHVRHLLGERVGVFVGGGDPWKMDSLPTWGALGMELGVWVHVGRVNTVENVKRCGLAGVHSFDGSSASRYAVTLPVLDRARAQHGFGSLAR